MSADDGETLQLVILPCGRLSTARRICLAFQSSNFYSTERRLTPYICILHSLPHHHQNPMSPRRPPLQRLQSSNLSASSATRNTNQRTRSRILTKSENAFVSSRARTRSARSHSSQMIIRTSVTLFAHSHRTCSRRSTVSLYPMRLGIIVRLDARHLRYTYHSTVCPHDLKPYA